MCVSVSICVSSHIFFSSFFFLFVCLFGLFYSGLLILFCIILLLDACLFSNERKKGLDLEGGEVRLYKKLGE